MLNVLLTELREKDCTRESTGHEEAEYSHPTYIATPATDTYQGLELSRRWLEVTKPRYDSLKIPSELRAFKDKLKCFLNHDVSSGNAM